MPRAARIDQPYLLYHVLARGIERRVIFHDDSDRDHFLTNLEEVLAMIRGARLYVWALMPNHIHCLVFVAGGSLKDLMRRLLTRYAVYFNRRHKRSGYLFQNRYKSIVVDHDVYFQELVRYIHLNPIHSGQIRTLEALAEYPYTGHSTLTGRMGRPWQDVEGVLREFGSARKEALQGYLTFIKEGIKADKRPDLAHFTKDSSVISQKDPDRFDRGILGEESLMERSEIGSQANLPARFTDIESLLISAAERFGVAVSEIRSGTKKRPVSQARSAFCYDATRVLGCSVIEVAAKLGLNPSSVSRAVSRRVVKQ